MRYALWTLLTASVLLVSLALSAPVSLVSQFRPLPPQVQSLTGTLRAGRAVLDGGITLTWRADWAALWRARYAADLRLTGPETLIEAQGWADWRTVGLRDATGRAGPELLALVPGAARCDGGAALAIARIAIARDAYAATGDITTRAATCRGPALPEVAVPPLRIALSSEGDGARAQVTAEDGTPYAEALVTPDRRARIRIEPAGARLVPGLPSSAPTELDLPF
ncbi:MAG: type II secretion system protein N [Shimia sp.]